MRSSESLLGIVAVLAALLLPARAVAQGIPPLQSANTNRSADLKSAIFSGSANVIWANNPAGFIGGGQANRIDARATNAVVAGGRKNVAKFSYATVGGGALNTAGYLGAVAGGGLNSANAAQSFIGGGFANLASGLNSVISGGWSNTASGDYAVVPGGTFNRATNTGAFVWSGTTNVATVSTNEFSFTVRAPGGVRFITSLADSAAVGSAPYETPTFTNGVYLAPNSGAWASLSDSNAKTKITPIKPREILAKLSSLRVAEWEYKSDPSGRRYIGPMSQDFHASFGLGADEKTISTLDSDGVMYAAIQGLVEEIKTRDEQHAVDLAERDKKISELTDRLKDFEKRLDLLPPSR